MFTGIVRGIATVSEVSDNDGLRALYVRFPARAMDGVERGASVSVAGTCLTVVDARGDTVRFDCIDETLARTTLGALRPGDPVNFERAARIGDEIGGHLLSGHVIDVGEIVGRSEHDGNLALTIRISASAARYVLAKGYVGVAGASLTVGEVDPVGSTFRVHLIPETRRITTLGEVAVGDRVNIEVDAMTQAVVDTVERVLASR
jgi:riboflavin synthase